MDIYVCMYIYTYINMCRDVCDIRPDHKLQNIVIFLREYPFTVS